MKFLPTLGVVAALVVTSALAQQAAIVQPTPDPAPAPVTALADAKPASFGDAKAGQEKAAVCSACHGMDGNSATDQFPKLAGQHEAYIWRQLKMFKSGERDNPIMLGMAGPLSEQDMRDLGAYFATQKIIPGVADDTPIASGPNQGLKYYEVGERIFQAGNTVTGVPACMGCHGPTGRGNPGSPYPAIAGQHASYIAGKLQFFRGGGTWGKGENANPVMLSVASHLSDEEIQGVATFLQGLHNASDAGQNKAP